MLRLSTNNWTLRLSNDDDDEKMSRDGIYVTSGLGIAFPSTHSLFLFFEVSEIQLAMYNNIIIFSKTSY